MHLSAPIYRLKRQAKLMARQDDIPLHDALDKKAVEEGFQSWSHLASSASHQSPADTLLSQLDAGDLILLGARPGHGKTLLGLALASNASRLGRKGYFFTLDSHEREVAERLSAIGVDLASVQNTLLIDTSDEVSADYIINRLKHEKEPAVIVVDYLQLLDQKRSNPILEDQVRSLQSYVVETGAICVVISQVDRSFDLGDKAMPSVADVRLPNPLDLAMFSKFFFLHKGKIQMERATVR